MFKTNRLSLTRLDKFFSIHISVRSVNFYVSLANFKIIFKNLLIFDVEESISQQYEKNKPIYTSRNY